MVHDRCLECFLPSSRIRIKLLCWHDYPSLFLWIHDLLMLPYFSAGMFLANKILARDSKTILSFSLSTFVSALLFTLTISPKISYFEGATSFVLLSLSMVSLIFLVVAKFGKWIGPQIFEFMGRHALFFYVYHVAVLYKLTVLLGIFKSLDFLTSIIVTANSLCIGCIIIYLHRRLSCYCTKCLNFYIFERYRLNAMWCL